MKTLKLKLTNLTKEIVKCGFPIGSLSKYIRIFNLNNLKFEIVDQAEKRFNALAEEIKTKVISKILKIDMFEISPKEAHNILFEIKKELENNL